MKNQKVPCKSGIYDYYKYELNSYELRNRGLDYFYTGDYYIVFRDDDEKEQLLKKVNLLQKLNALKDGLFFVLKLLFWISVVLGVLFLLLLILGYLPLSKSCENTGLIMGLQHKFNFWAGCFLNYKGMWIPADQIIRVVTGK